MLPHDTNMVPFVSFALLELMVTRLHHHHHRLCGDHCAVWVGGFCATRNWIASRPKCIMQWHHCGGLDLSIQGFAGGLIDAHAKRFCDTELGKGIVSWWWLEPVTTLLGRAPFLNMSSRWRAPSSTQSSSQGSKIYATTGWLCSLGTSFFELSMGLRDHYFQCYVWCWSFDTSPTYL
jgi:hypothetical protein